MDRSLRDEVEALASRWRETARQMQQLGVNGSQQAAKLLASAHELESAIARHPPADGVVVPRGLFEEMIDHCRFSAAHIKTEALKKLVNEIIAQADAILSEGKA